jgi:hypothetical protein
MVRLAPNSVSGYEILANCFGDKQRFDKRKADHTGGAVSQT